MAEFPNNEMTEFPAEWVMIDEERGWLLCAIWNRFKPIGDGEVYQEINWTMLHYAGNGQWSYEEDIYNPNEFGVMVGRYLKARRAAGIEQTMSKIAPVVVPLFFIHIGIKANATKFVSPPVLGIATIVFVVAMGTKLLSGFGVSHAGTDRITVGLAMAPRGEVGLIFAATAVSAGAFDDRMYAAVLLAVLATTIVTPILLRRRLSGS